MRGGGIHDAHDFRTSCAVVEKNTLSARLTPGVGLEVITPMKSTTSFLLWTIAVAADVTPFNRSAYAQALVCSSLKF